MRALCSGRGDCCHSLQCVKGIKDFGEDLGEDDHLGEEETTALVFGAFFTVRLVIFDVGEVVGREGLHGPV